MMNRIELKQEAKGVDPHRRRLCLFVRFALCWP